MLGRITDRMSLFVPSQSAHQCHAPTCHRIREPEARSHLSHDQAAEMLGVSPRTIFRYESGQSRPSPIGIKWIKEYIAKRSASSFDRRPAAFTFIDLFAGIGGLRTGFEAIGGRCVFTSEWDRYCQKTYRENFPDDGHTIAGDIRQVNERDIPAHDVLLAGFPCQPFSIAGVSKKNALKRPHGFACETQGTLFYEVQRILQYHRPAVFLLENVKNLVNHDQGRTFRVIHDILTRELKYHVDVRVIDAKPWVPQHRERIFIAGFRNSTDFRFDTLQVRAALEGPKSRRSCIRRTEQRNRKNILPEGDKPTSQRNTRSRITCGPICRITQRSTARKAMDPASDLFARMTSLGRFPHDTSRMARKYSSSKKEEARGALLLGSVLG